MRPNFLLFFLLLKVNAAIGQSFPDLIPFRSGEKWGYCDSTAKMVIQSEFDYVFPFFNGVAQVTKDKKVALINRSGNIVMPFEQQLLREVGETLLLKTIITPNESLLMGVVDIKNKTIIPCEYDDISSNGKVFILEKSDRYGVADYSGNILINSTYNYISELANGYYVGRKDNNHALFGPKGEQLTEFKYMVIGDFRNKLSKVRVKDQFGFVDSKGHEFIPVIYEMAYPFSNGYAVIEQNGKWGLLDSMGKTVIKPQYDLLKDLHRGVASYKKGTKWGLVDSTGKEILGAELDDVQRAYNGVMAGKKDLKWAIVSPMGRLLTGFEYDEIEVLDNTEDKVRDFGWKTPEQDEGYLMIKKDSKWGVIDLNGKLILKTDYEKIYSYTNQKALVKKDGKWAVAALNGKNITPFIYEKLDPYIAGVYNMKNHSIILFIRDGKWGILNTNGKELASGFDYVVPADDNYYVVFKDKKFGLIDSNGKTILSLKYDRILLRRKPGSFIKTAFIDNICLVEIGGKQGYVGINGIEYFR